MANEGNFRFDPFTGMGTVTYNSGASEQMGIEQWSGGRWRLERTSTASQIVDTLNSFNRTTIGVQGDAGMEYFPGLGYGLISETQRGTANRTIAPDTMRRATGNITVMTREGDVLVYPFEGAPLASAGYQWAVFTDYDGGKRMTRVPARYGSNAQLQADYNDRWRLATNEEVIFNAAAYQIARDTNFWNDLGLIEAQMGDLPEGDEDSEAIGTFLFQAGSLQDVQVYMHTLME